MEGEGTLITRIPVNEIYRDGNVACTYVDKLFYTYLHGPRPATADAKAKKPVSLKKDNGGGSHAGAAMKIYYRGCWPNNNRSLDSGGGGRRRREKGSNFRSNCISREEGIALCENLSPPEIVLGCRKIFESIWKSRRQRQSVRGRIPIVVERVLNYLSVKLNGIHYPSNSYPVLSRKSICKCYKCALSKFSISPHFSRQFVPFLRIPIIK